MELIMEASKKPHLEAAKDLAAAVVSSYKSLLDEKLDRKRQDRLRKKVASCGAKLLDVHGQLIESLVYELSPEQKQDLKAELQKPDASKDIAEVVAKLYGLTPVKVELPSSGG